MNREGHTHAKTLSTGVRGNLTVVQFDSAARYGQPQTVAATFALACLVNAIELIKYTLQFGVG
ncbi:hypothetical protein GCM10007052_00730 [Halioglobus japonicus]|nr:hypothetical protein GCM10007052_00730 [Halioglobus japonicus]